MYTTYALSSAISASDLIFRAFLKKRLHIPIVENGKFKWLVSFLGYCTKSDLHLGAGLYFKKK